MNAKKRMIYAIKGLLDKYPIQKITTDMIVKESDLSKTTFYRYFQDKYMLMKEYYFYVVDNILSKKGTTFEEIYINLMEFIKANKEYFTELTKQPGQENFITTFYESSYFHANRIMENNKKEPLTSDEQLQLSLFIYGCAHLTEEWIKSNFKETPQSIVTTIRKCVPNELDTYL